MAPHPDTWTSKSVRNLDLVETMTADPSTGSTVPPMHLPPAVRHVHRVLSLSTVHRARLYCYLQAVIFQGNVNSLIIGLRGAGLPVLDDIYHKRANTSHVYSLS